MSKFVTVTKKFILDALSVNEKNGLLKPGSFIGHPDRNDLKFKTCEVCAVGAIFRQALAPTKKLRDLYFHIEDATNQCMTNLDFNEDEEVSSNARIYNEASDLVTNKDYLSALSVCFEGLGYEETVRLVEEEFPKTIKLDINGFKLSPALAGKTLKKEPAAKKKNVNKSKR